MKILNYSKVKGDKYKHKTRMIEFLAIAIASIFIAVIVTQYVFKEHSRQISLTEEHLIEITERNTAIVRSIFDNYVNTLRALSVYTKNFDDLNSQESVNFLKNMSDAFNFERLSIVFPDGQAYNQNGVSFNITDKEHLDLVKNGQIFISNLTNSAVDGTPILRIQVPIHRDGMPVASLSYSMTIENLNNVLLTKLSGIKGYFCIIDENGNYVAISSEETFSTDINFFDSLDSLVYNEGFSKELIEEAFTDYKAGHTEYTFEEMIRYGYYAPVGINKWVMLTVIPKNLATANTNEFVESALLLAIQIALILVAVSFMVYSDQKRTKAKIELDEHCFRILAEQTGKVVLEWDYTDKILYYPNFENTVGRKPVQESLTSPEEVISKGSIHPDDADLFRQMFYDLSHSRNVRIPRLRLRAADESFHYYSVSSTVIYDNKGKPYKSIGFMENIDSLVRNEKYLRRKAETDQLTGFYNKSAAEIAISDFIASSSNKVTHALLCVDLDNFKSINDEFGHLYGDKVLKELSELIKKIFRKNDILGRFGGDEFIIFVPDIPNKKFIKTKAAELNELLKKTYSKNGIECTVSASIGISIFPTDGKTYKSLYEKADKASYEVKNSTKNSYRFFH